MTRWISYNFIL